MAQYDTFRDESKRDYLAKQIIFAKKKSQLQLLQKIGSSVDTLPDEEAHASMIYFSEYAKFIPKRFGFSSRNQSFSGASKRNAKDIINALLNYGYAVLAGEISKFVNGVGLDAYYGFMHKNHGNSQSLVYDLIEPFRWMVDYAVI
jgi:CRISPR-associated protein Cas1